MSEELLNDFTSLSERSADFETMLIRVANGTKFAVLVMSRDQMEAASGVLYIHVHGRTGRCYFGITEQAAGARWLSGKGYKGNQRFGRAIQRHSWDSFNTYILGFGDSRGDLEEAEIRAIASAGGHNSQFTYNVSPGGDLVADNAHPVFGIHLPSGKAQFFKSGSDAARKLGIPSTDQVSAVVRKERVSVGDWWFRAADDMSSLPPAAWGENLRVSRVREISAKPLVAVNLKSLERREFSSATSAAEALGLFQTSISAVARKEQASAGGWTFFEKGQSERLPEVYGAALTRLKRDRPVYGFELSTGNRRSFRNCVAADNELGLHLGAASSVANQARASAGGWYFSFQKDAEPPVLTGFEIVAKARSKPVVAINLFTGERFNYHSAKAAAEVLGMSRAAISKILSGDLSSAKGWRFEWPKS